MRFTIFTTGLVLDSDLVAFARLRGFVEKFIVDGDDFSLAALNFLTAEALKDVESGNDAADAGALDKRAFAPIGQQFQQFNRGIGFHLAKENASPIPVVSIDGRSGSLPAPGTASSPGPVGDQRDEEIKRAFDVYATPFVPESLKVINRYPGIEISTLARRSLDWTQCSSISFASGLHLALTHSPLPATPDLQRFQIPPADLDLEGYEHFFGYHLAEELGSQRKAAAVYSLYSQRTVVRFAETEGAATCTLTVPGLKEYAPYLEEDDVVQLRQLTHDKPLVHGRAYMITGWTGVIYHARVTAVRRAEETVTLLVAELARSFLGNGSAWKYEDMGLALHILQDVLALNTRGVEDLSTSDILTYDSEWLRAVLFPVEADGKLQTKLHRGKFRQKFVDQGLNWEQKKAVQAICERNHGAMPYLVSGPPGTGKTKTVIETALQLIKQGGEDAHILLCAPSETAADTLAIRLRDYFRPGELFRLNRPTRTFAEVPGSILHFCYTLDTGFALPPLDELLKCRVVVTSCQDAALLVRARVTNMDIYRMKRDLSSLLGQGNDGGPKRLHWTALLIDEAAQAMEPEVLIPLAVIAPPLTAAPPPIFAMVGDQYQLSPRVSLPFSPLKRSLFARLFDRLVYKNHPLARGAKGEAPPVLKPSMLPISAPPFTNLFRNYRSHPAILAVPSALFYHDTLEPEAPGRRGWYNMREIDIALSYVSSLVTSDSVARRNICVMSPFKAQVMRLRREFRRVKEGLRDGEVLEKDQEVGWGIIGEAQANAMNVALTRAKYGLIVIGKGEILATDPNWQGFLNFCDRNGLVAGAGKQTIAVAQLGRNPQCKS
ncbi:unnamed protein product [Parascedosporium putredinis]|uniref:DNA2/NAM7 helicase helicase domain-containing protein n=1 Tax=Parascedosporium putredinis TaxID=1442378 RepID=A0A9P1MC40_9PEZI|nr:unnamed protein product [Parascedosporium putredinis]CAI7999899.1 unnamed protein product [Parascedosporium putredinis]